MNSKGRELSAFGAYFGMTVALIGGTGALVGETGALVEAPITGLVEAAPAGADAFEAETPIDPETPVPDLAVALEIV